MHRAPLAAVAIVATAVLACGRGVAVSTTTGTGATTARMVSANPGESHLANIRQLTYGGENAEAYFSADGRWVTFQSTRDGRTCDQQYVMRSDGTELRRISDGAGKTTCGYFLRGDRRLVYASTHAADTACPPKPDPSRGYVWGLDPFDLYTVNADGTDRRRLTSYGVYTAEATLSPDGRTIVFTSLKDGDLDIYTMNADGTNIRRLTNTPGYDGGAFFSPDGKQIVYRAWHPQGDSLRAYQALLAQRLVRPNRMELFVMNADGTNNRQITNLGGANFAPIFTPDGRRIIFSSNHKNPRGREAQNFELFLINLDGTGLEQVTTHPTFDGFPMFSRDFKKLIWASNRHSPQPNGTDIFVADWVP